MDIYMDPLDTLMFVEKNRLSGNILKQVFFGSAMSNVSNVLNKKAIITFFCILKISTQNLN